MKNAVIVYYHPYQGSFCHAILEATTKGLKNSGYQVDVIDLQADKFDPVMSSTDLLAFVKHQMVDEQALDYVKRLKKASKLVFIFPIWWELMPAMVKGFIDKVIFPGSTYEYAKTITGMKTALPFLKQTQVITTMNTPKYVYQFIFGNAVKKALVTGTLKKTGLKNVKWLNLTGVKSRSDEKRQLWLTKIEQNMAK
ncbi:NAD(P)H-dependent oxidoreductase [Pediococcus siamensis]|uniref:NAD(P)H-dependent oxidoreductase n=1 Tax=Pediococcus siamensis TaxID=381829 RepID=UPI0039A33027